MFLAGEKNEIPLAKFYEIPPQKATCPAKFKDTWKRGKFSKKCGFLQFVFLGEGVGEELVSGGELGGFVVTFCKDFVKREVW